MAGTLAGILAQRTPAVGEAGALTSDWVAAPVRVALADLATIWSPELRWAACLALGSIKARWTTTHSWIHTNLISLTGLLTLTHRYYTLLSLLSPSIATYKGGRVTEILTNVFSRRVQFLCRQVRAAEQYL